MEAENESGLLARAAHGDTEAFRELFETHHGAIFRFAYRLTGSVDVAEELTQECFVRLMRRPRFHQERGSLRQFLYGIARNLVRQRQQVNRREGNWDDEAQDGPRFTVAELPDSIASAELAAVVQAAISALPSLQREAIVLCEFEELSLHDAAEVLGVDVGTVKSRLHRAREGLRRSLAPYRSQARMPSPKGSSL